MALEMRGSSGPYYYKKVRDGNTVRSVYHGRGELALLEHRWDEMARDAAADRAIEQALELKMENLADVDRSVATVASIADEIVDATFLVHGYHKHSRSWRRKWQNDR